MQNILDDKTLDGGLFALAQCSIQQRTEGDGGRNASADHLDLADAFFAIEFQKETDVLILEKGEP